MNVEIIKLHPNFVGLFREGDVVRFIPSKEGGNAVVIHPNGSRYDARDFTMCWSYPLSYAEVFRKTEKPLTTI